MNSLTPHQQKALNYDRHISLTANAGSGKTFVLARRYLEIALAEKGSLKKIAAITFTDKAASDLYKKITDEVEKRLIDSNNPEERNLLNKIRHQLVSANIATIHSFCIDILKEFPVEAGLDANFRPIDELTSNELIELSVEEAIKESLSGSDSEKTKYLVRFSGSKFALSRQMKKLIKERKKVIILREDFYNHSEEEIAERFYKDFCDTAGEIMQHDRDKFINSLTAINEFVQSEKKGNTKVPEIKKLLKEFEVEQSFEKKIDLLCSIKSHAFTIGGKVRDAGYLSRGLRNGFTQEIFISEKYIRDVSPLNIVPNHKEIEKELARFGLLCLNLFNKVLEKYESRKKENGYLDYEDILIFTKNILKYSSVKAELSRKFRYIMVDEYQDTNEIQYNIFLPILDDLQSGNLFVVGDEKQSIYMFRDAELEVFRITKQNISDVSGNNSLLSLPDSFRMAPGICLFVNKVFRNLFSNPNELFNEVLHSDLVCAKNDDMHSLIEIIIGSDENVNKNNINIRLSEAELVAGRIISLINETEISKKLRWRDIAVLVRKRKSFAELEKTFLEKNIPFSIVGGKGFYQRQSIYDIYNYFSFLLDDKNDTALVGILRSPFFSVSDSVIYEVYLNRGETLWQKLRQHRNINEKLRGIIEALELNISLVRTQSPSQILRKILSDSPYLSVLAQQAAGEQEIANISKLVRLTIDFQSKGFKTLYDYVNFLKESIEETDDEAQAAIADESDSVKIMTLHQAKGLEFPAVFLFNAHEVAPLESIKKGTFLIDKKFGLLTKIPSKDYFGESESAPINIVSDLISLKKENAEIKRLFYVGATRAKNYLFISAPEAKAYKDNSFIGLLQNGLNLDLSKDEYILEEDLTFLKKENEHLRNYSEFRREKIKIRRDLKDVLEYNIDSNRTFIKPELLLNVVKDLPKGEFITATKFAVFKQCPLKYQLTYDYGISGLILGYKKFLINNRNEKKKRFDFNARENGIEAEEVVEKYISSELRGNIFHKILQRNISPTPEEIMQVIISEAADLTEKDRIKLADDIIVHLNKLFESSVYKKIRAFKNFYNEYEIYLNEKNYFLHGIIDKLILENDKAIIIDYKTDDLEREEISEHAKVYFPQLKFYSYIINTFYKDLSIFELRLIFLKFPDVEVVEVVEKESVLQFGYEIEQMVLQIRSGKYERKVSQCKDCNLALNNNCIIE